MFKFLIILMPLMVFAGMDTVTIQHQYYTTTFDTVKHYPVLVQWWLTKAMLDCQGRLKRVNKFTFDPKLARLTDLSKDYLGSGYDRGHNMPADNNECDHQALIECFYFSNMTPQAPSLNRGIWERLEGYTRDLAEQHDSVKVWCGSIGEAKKIGRVSVPTKCWKEIYIKKSQKYEAYIFDNNAPKVGDNFQAHKVTLDSLNKITGFILK